MTVRGDRQRILAEAGLANGQVRCKQRQLVTTSDAQWKGNQDSLAVSPIRPLSHLSLPAMLVD
jgi:hypothetical protein